MNVLLQWLLSSRACRALLVVTTGVALVVLIVVAQQPALSSARIAMEILKQVTLVVTVAGAVYALLQASGKHVAQLALLRSLLHTHRRSVGWRATVADIILRLGAAIDREFERWELSESERETAFLLLKGYTFAEIAALRNYSDRELHRDARSIYRKAGLDGRVAFSTYFLDDLRQLDGGW